MSALSRRTERPMLEEIGRLDASTAERGAHEASTDSAFLSHLASADLEELAHIFGRAYLRFASRDEAETKHRSKLTSLAEVGAVEPSCVRANGRAENDDMKLETNGDHVCAQHASPDARAMRLPEIADHIAETGCTPRCAKCLYMSERGEIACGSHAPYAGSDSWTLDRWALITAAESAEFQTAVGYAPRCTACPR